MYLCILKGARGGVVFKVLRYKAAGRGFDSRWCHWNFSGRSMALESIQVYFRGVGGKGGRCIRLTTLPPSCAVTMKSGNLNFLEPSGPGPVTGLLFTQSTLLRFLWISEQTAVISFYGVDLLVFITKIERVYCVVRA